MKPYVFAVLLAADLPVGGTSVSASFDPVSAIVRISLDNSRSNDVDGHVIPR
jgi:hypothetical protein